MTGQPELLAAALAAARDGTVLRLPGVPTDSPAAPGTWLVAATSGTTGSPRLVRRTWESWRASFAPFARLTGTGPASRVLVPGPLTATLSLFAAVHARAVGAAVALEPLGTATPWTHAHVVPTQLADLVRTGRDLRGRTVVVAGASLDAALAGAAVAAGLTVRAYYGASELSLVALGPPGRLVPFPGVLVRADDGLLRVRSPYLALGVAGQDGWATVGDRGRVAPDGSVVVHGRGSAAVVTGGATVLAEDVEAVLRGVPGVRDAVVIGTPHPRLGEVVTAVVEPGDPAPSLAVLRAACATHLSPAQRPRRWWQVPVLPRTDAGKPRRAGLAGLLGAGGLGARRLT